MNLLHYHYYPETRIPTSLKIRKIRAKNKILLKNFETPEPLKVERYKLSPILRAKTLGKRPKLISTELKPIIDQNQIFSESFNNYIENHALTNISPVEIINHYKIESRGSCNKPFEFILERQTQPIEVPKNTIICDFSYSDLHRLDEELFKKSEKKKRPIIRFGEKVDKNFEIIGNTLSLSGRRSLTRSKRKKSVKSENRDRKLVRLKDVRLKSPEIQLNSTDSLIPTQK